MALTAGIILLNTYIPSELRFKENDILDSKTFNGRLALFAKKYPKEYAKNISHITTLGEKISFYMGSNVGIDDIDFGNKEVDNKVNQLEKKINAEHNVHKKRDMMLKGFKSMTDLVDKNIKKKNNNEILAQIQSGSRGNSSQLARASFSPVYSVDMNQNPKSTMIKNNFVKGLSPAEYFNVASQGRFASVAAANATAEPGALSKVIIANVDDMKITMDDCHTTNGKRFKNDDPHIIGRFLSRSNKLITPEMFHKISKEKGYATVRSPETCEAKRGICVKCYGLRSNGNLPKIGDNVGIEAGQTIGEVLTQMTLSTKHSTMGKSDGEDKLEGVKGFNSLYGSKEKDIGMAIIAKNSGKVLSISKNTNNTKVIIGYKTYYIPKEKKVLVKLGDYIKANTPITNGIISPEAISISHGIYKARSAESDEAHAIFKRSTGKDLQKKHFEVISRGHLSLARNNNGGYSNYDNAMSGYPKIKRKIFLSKNTIGKYLGENIGYIPKGTLITEELYNKLMKWNIKKFEVTDQKPPVKPVYKSLEQRPLFGNNLFGKMNYRGIGNAIKDQIVYNSNDNNISSDKSLYSGQF